MSSIHQLKAPRYTTFASMQSGLLSAGAGSLGVLYGPSTWIGVWKNTTGAAVQLVSDLRFWAASGDEFSVGADGDGDDIETYNGATAPTWGSPGSATGGLIMDGSGAYLLPMLGIYDPACMVVCAKCVAQTVNAAANAGFGVGTFSAGRTKGFLGGIYYSTTDWYRKYNLMVTAPTLVPGGTASASYDVALAADDAVSINMAWVATDRTSNFGAYIAGGFRGDETGVSNSQQSGSGSSAMRTGDTDHEIVIHCDAAGGAGLVVRVREIYLAFISL